MSGVGPSDARVVRAWRAPLLRWYRKNRRDLPWRRTRDPYAVWVSEVMLQQTTVAAVIPYWERFLARLPTIDALAAASEESVLGLWSGLGYYRRARALREGAIVVRDRFGGSLPADPESLREIPGIGPYTAGAIASLAFGREVPLVDGNVKRVFSRLLARDAAGARESWEVAALLVRGAAPGDLNQALMELGATVCTPRAPKCPACPLRGRCAALASGEPETWPHRRARPRPRSVRVAVALVVDRGRVLVERRREGAPLRGAWDLPARVVRDGDDPARALSRALAREHGARLRAARSAGAARHAILDTRLALEIVAFDLASPPRGDRARWLALDTLDEAPVSGATRKVVAAALHGPSHGKRNVSSRPAVARGRSSGSGGSGRSKA